MVDQVTVEVTDPKYKILRHEPDGASFGDDGRSIWTLDQFTHRLVAEGSVRIVEDDKSAEKGNAEKKESPAPSPLTPASDALRKEK